MSGLRRDAKLCMSWPLYPEKWTILYGDWEPTGEIFDTPKEAYRRSVELNRANGMPTPTPYMCAPDGWTKDKKPIFRQKVYLGSYSKQKEEDA